MEDDRKIIHAARRQLKHGKEELDFFELVRRLDQVHSSLPRVGFSNNISQETLRFGQQPYLNFPESTVAEIAESSSGASALIFVYFMGLTGVNGPMPLEFTNYVFQRAHNHYDMTWRRFLDIINHKMISLFYRAWASMEQAVCFDRRDDDSISHILKGICGLSALEKQADDGMPYAGIHYGQYMVVAPKSRNGIENILNDYFSLPLKIRGNIQEFYDIPHEFRCRLGRQETSQIGKNAQIGSRFLSRTKKFIIEIGTIDFNNYISLLPGKSGFNHLISLVNMYLDRPLQYDIVFHIEGKSVPRTCLNGTQSLGRSVWLASKRHKFGVEKLRIGASRMVAKEHLESYR